MVTASCDIQQPLDSFDPSLSDKNWNAQLKEQVCSSVSACVGHTTSTASGIGDRLEETSEWNKNNLTESKHMTPHSIWKSTASRGKVLIIGDAASSVQLRTKLCAGRRWQPTADVLLSPLSAEIGVFSLLPTSTWYRFKPWNDSYRKNIRKINLAYISIISQSSLSQL